MRRIPFEAWLVALILILHLYAALVPANSLMQWFRSDDAFYYFKTAQNISEGHGITFDGLGRDSGFHPLWMALLVPIFSLARFDLILPLRLVVLIAGLFNAGTAVLIYRLARRALRPPTAAFAALMWAFHPLILSDITQLGLESGISAFFVVLLITRLAKTGLDEKADVDAREMQITGLIAALAVLARLDNVFLVLAAGVWLSIRPTRMRILILVDILLVSLGVLWSYMTRVGFGAVFAQMSASQLWMVAGALAVRAGLFLLFGLYRRPQAGQAGLFRCLAKTAGAVLLGSALLASIMLGLFALHLFPSFPRLVLVYEGVFALIAGLVTRLVSWLLQGKAGEEEAEFRWGPSLARAGRFFVPIGLVLIVYISAHMAYFGTPTPVSGQIKRWWGTLPNPIYGRPVETLPGLLGFFDRSSPWALARNLAGWPALLPETVRLGLYGLLALAIILAARRQVWRSISRMAIIPLLVGALLQLISYTGTGYLHMRGWYWVSHMLLITLLVAVLLDAWLLTTGADKPEKKKFSATHPTFLRRLTGFSEGQSSAVLAVGLLCALLVISGSVRIIHQMPPWVNDENREYYLTGARELEAATEAGARIGSTGGGVIAYFVQDRTIVNLDGLMNTTEYFHALQTGRAADYLDKLGLNYVYASENVVTSSDPYFQYTGHLKKLSTFWGSTLFRWLPAAQ